MYRIGAFYRDREPWKGIDKVHFNCVRAYGQAFFTEHQPPLGVALEQTEHYIIYK